MIRQEDANPCLGLKLTGKKTFDGRFWVRISVQAISVKVYLNSHLSSGICSVEKCASNNVITVLSVYLAGVPRI